MNSRTANLRGARPRTARGTRRRGRGRSRGHVVSPAPPLPHTAASRPPSPNGRWGQPLRGRCRDAAGGTGAAPAPRCATLALGSPFPGDLGLPAGLRSRAAASPFRLPPLGRGSSLRGDAARDSPRPPGREGRRGKREAPSPRRRNRAEAGSVSPVRVRRRDPRGPPCARPLRGGRRLPDIVRRGAAPLATWRAARCGAVRSGAARHGRPGGLGGREGAAAAAGLAWAEHL